MLILWVDANQLLKQVTQTESHLSLFRCYSTCQSASIIHFVQCHLHVERIFRAIRLNTFCAHPRHTSHGGSSQSSDTFPRRRRFTFKIQCEIRRIHSVWAAASKHNAQPRVHLPRSVHFKAATPLQRTLSSDAACALNARPETNERQRNVALWNERWRRRRQRFPWWLTVA